MITFNSVSKMYEEKSGQKYALDNVSFTISQREIFAIVGHNGAGKTTFINLILGLMRPASGEVKHSNREMITSCVMEDLGLWPKLTVRENFKYFGALYDIPEHIARERTSLYSALFDIEHIGGSYIYTLSKGQRKIVSFIMAASVNPELMILDEVTANLDPDNQEKVFEILLKMNKELATTIIFSTHNLSEVESFSNHIVSLKNGKVKANWYPSKVQHFLCLECKGRTDAIIAQIEEYRLPHYQTSASTISILVDSQKVSSIKNKLKHLCDTTVHNASTKDLYFLLEGVYLE